MSHFDLNKKFNDLAWEIANKVDQDRAYVGSEIQAIALSVLQAHSGELGSPSSVGKEFQDFPSPKGGDDEQQSIQEAR